MDAKHLGLHSTFGCASLKALVNVMTTWISDVECSFSTFYMLYSLMVDMMFNKSIHPIDKSGFTIWAP